MEVKKKIDAGEKIFLLDVRGPDEYEEMHLGLGELNIPLGKVRPSIDRFPKDKNAEITVYCKISLRGYEAACFIRSAGYSNVKVMEGGIIAWPYPRKK